MEPIYKDAQVTLYTGDSRAIMRELPPGSVQCCVTSPPYWGLRDYGVTGQLGLEATPDDYVAAMVEVFREVKRVLRNDGTLWLNLGDSYAANGVSGLAIKGESSTLVGTANIAHASIAKTVPAGLKAKDLVGIPWRVAFALQADGWYLRSDIIWSKPNPMPESVTDRPTRAHEYIFLLSKSERYYYDHIAIRDAPSREWWNEAVSQTKPNPNRNDGGHRTDKQRGHGRRHAGFNQRWDAMSRDEQMAMGRNKRSVWEIASEPYPGAHFAVFPRKLVEPCILAGAPAQATVLDPFSGSGTTAYVAKDLGRYAIGIDLNPTYHQLAIERLRQDVLPLAS